jgi:hypothetical protein
LSSSTPKRTSPLPGLIVIAVLLGMLWLVGALIGTVVHQVSHAYGLLRIPHDMSSGAFTWVGTIYVAATALVYGGLLSWDKAKRSGKGNILEIMVFGILALAVPFIVLSLPVKIDPGLSSGFTSHTCSNWIATLSKVEDSTCEPGYDSMSRTALTVAVAAVVTPLLLIWWEDYRPRRKDAEPQ